MDDNIKQVLEKRNQRLIDAIIEKGEKVCPNAIDLIGIYGSFCTGDIHEKSDLDLLIVINSDEGRKVSSCFILGEVAHDIYCTTWENVESISLYEEPQIAKIMEAKIVYSRNDRQLERLGSIRQKVKEKLNKSFSMEDYEKAEKQVKNAVSEYAKVMMNDQWDLCVYASAAMLYYLENALCMLNKTYFKKGTKRTPEELEALQKHPEDFMMKYQQVIRAATVGEIKSSSSELMKLVSDYFDEQKLELLGAKKEPSESDINGSYEEIYSNWRNKMYYAAECNNIYLAMMTAMNCQYFYDAMYSEFAIEKLNIMEKFQKKDLHASAKVFDEVMETYKHIYDSLGKKIVYYSTINDFVNDYLR